MNMVKISCPDCQSIGQMSLLDEYYKGPYRCWKCRGNFLLEMDHKTVMSCSPLSQDEFDRFVAEKAARDRNKSSG